MDRNAVIRQGKALGDRRVRVSRNKSLFPSTEKLRGAQRCLKILFMRRFHLAWVAIRCFPLKPILPEKQRDGLRDPLTRTISRSYMHVKKPLDRGRSIEVSQSNTASALKSPVPIFPEDIAEVPYHSVELPPQRSCSSIPKQNSRKTQEAQAGASHVLKYGDYPQERPEAVPRFEPPPGNKKLMGLQNTGLNCFVNSVLNSVFFIPQVYYYFTSHLLVTETGIFDLLKQFFIQYGKTPIPAKLSNQIRCYFPKFRTEAMGSAYEFLNSVLRTLDEETRARSQGSRMLEYTERTIEYELEREKAVGCRPMHEIFSVLIEETLKCTNCPRSTSKFSYLRSLSLNLIPAKQIYGARKNLSQGSLSLESCLLGLLEKQIDSEDAMHFCKECKCDQIHSLEKTIKHIGSALIIYLQRFHSTNPSAQVTVPKTLNMRDYLPSSGLYSLCSVIQHEGSGATGGHYTCYAKSYKGWMFFNDSFAEFRNISEYDLNSSTLFIYSKVEN